MVFQTREGKPLKLFDLFLHVLRFYSYWVISSLLYMLFISPHTGIIALYIGSYLLLLSPFIWVPLWLVDYIVYSFIQEEDDSNGKDEQT